MFPFLVDECLCLFFLLLFRNPVERGNASGFCASAILSDPLP